MAEHEQHALMAQIRSAAAVATERFMLAPLPKPGDKISIGTVERVEDDGTIWVRLDDA